MKNKPTEKQRAEFFLLNLEEDIKDIKQHLNGGDYDFTVEKIVHILITPFLCERDLFNNKNSHE